TLQSLVSYHTRRRRASEEAIALALIVNELVTNAVKYAFSNRNNGHIYVCLARQDAGTALVSVRDDGIGLAADFDLTKSKGLGMQIVTGLASNQPRRTRVVLNSNSR